jgi:hypothetical protein
MGPLWLKRIVGALVGVLVVAGVLWLAWPRPIPVDLAAVTKGPMQVTIDDEGKTRVRHVYTVSAPVAGKVLRISHPADKRGVSLHVGDHVTADETVVAIMQPAIPPGRTMARCGLRMMPPFPSSPLSFRKASFPRYGWKAGVSGGTFPARRSA